MKPCGRHTWSFLKYFYVGSVRWTKWKCIKCSETMDTR